MTLRYGINLELSVKKFKITVVNTFKSSNGKVESTQEEFDDMSREKKTKGKYIVPIYILDMIKERINELTGKTGKQSV